MKCEKFVVNKIEEDKKKKKKKKQWVTLRHEKGYNNFTKDMNLVEKIGELKNTCN